jgi:NAD+ kinase
LRGEFSTFFSGWAIYSDMDSGPSVIGVVDGSADIATTLEAAGGRVRTGTAESVVSSDPDTVVAVGETAALAVARQRPSMPLVPVAAGRGLRSVPSDRTADVAASIVGGDWELESHPLVRVEYAGETVARALTDVTLVTSEAARISEFSVTADGDHVGQLRADGIVVATPAGTPGYARRLGTPIAAASTGIVAVAPIAPFATNPDHWTVPDDRLRVTVERDDAEVRLFADDRSIVQVAFDEPVTLTTEQSIEVALLSESRPRFP